MHRYSNQFSIVIEFKISKVFVKQPKLNHITYELFTNDTLENSFKINQVRSLAIRDKCNLFFYNLGIWLNAQISKITEAS